MKHIKSFILIGLIAGSALAAQKVEVDFVDTEDFTDFTSTPRQSAEVQQRYIQELTQHLERRLTKRLAPGQVIHLVVTDIDMAGEFEPWRTGGFDDVRVVKNLYPPRIDLSYRLTDAEGNVLRESDCKLRDLSFMYSVDPRDSDPLRHEKELISDWIHDEFAKTS